MKSLGRRLKAVERRVRTGETPEIEVWYQDRSSEHSYWNKKLDLTLTREALDRRTAERRERYGEGHVLAIVVNYEDTPVPEWGRP